MTSGALFESRWADVTKTAMSALAIVESLDVIDLAHNFDLTVVAEGVENAESLDLLTSMGCELAQGFYLARPMPFDKLIEWNAESPWGR